MKKKTIILTIFLMTIEVMYSQNLEYRFLTQGDVTICSISGGSCWLEYFAILEDESQVSFFFKNGGNLGSSNDIVFTTSGKIKQILLRDAGFTVIPYNTYTSEEIHDFEATNCTNNNIDAYVGGNSENNIQVFQILPLVKIITPDPGSDNSRETINLEATPGYDSSVYLWQYFDSSSSSWESFPALYTGKSSISFSAEDLFGNNYLNYIGISIPFRLNACQNTPHIYVFINSSPKLLSFTPTNTQCSYSDDGSFSMNLDRDLNSNEKLVASLFFENEFMPGEYNLLTQKITESLIDNGNGTYTYNWPSDTPILAGNYKVRYQSLDTSESNPVWSSLEDTEMGFTIGNPPPIKFSATKRNDVYCNDGSDGAIQLNASGGVSNFKYELNNSGVWIPFTATNAHTITGLPQGTKTIKVQDANGCTEKE